MANRQNDKERSTKHHTENKQSSNTDSTTTDGILSQLQPMAYYLECGSSLVLRTIL